MSKSPSIPEELIRIKAHEFSEKRQREGRDGTPESDGEKAVDYFKKHRWEVFLWELRHPDSRDFALDVVKTCGIILTAIGLFFTVYIGLEDRRLTQERLVTDRFSKAVEQLGKYKDIQGKTPDITVRIGGIYALERIANDSAKDHWTIMEVLTSYVRENYSLPSEFKQYPQNEQEREQRLQKLKELSEVSIDVQAVLTVIGRREDPEPDRKERIDLSYANLKRALLRDADLSHANLWGANLSRAQLTSANLRGADLRFVNLIVAGLGVADLRDAKLGGANLHGAQLIFTKLSHAKLGHANLSHANLHGANLSGAFLIDADLSHAYLYGANLHGANLHGANLRLAVFGDMFPNDTFVQSTNLNSANLSGSNLWGAIFGDANLSDANLSDANLSRALFIDDNLNSANLIRANLSRANLSRALLINVKNLTSFQIKSACSWTLAIYKAKWNNEKKTFVTTEPDNKNYIEELKKDKSSDPKEPPDCSRWEEE